jgi:translation initiation factor 1
LRIQQRTGRKRITTVQGLDDKKYDLKFLLKEFKKDFHCNGSIDEDPEFGKVIRLTGDNRMAIRDFLVKENVASKDNIKIHGE